MTAVLSEKKWATLGLLFSERERRFISDHPEFKDVTPYLRGAYRTCQAARLTGDPVELDEAYEHYLGCSWCQAYFNRLATPLKQLLADKGGAPSR